jgi:hypothetical protein
MMARRKVERVQIGVHHSLEKRVARARLATGVAAVIEKDRHLIEAALATDRRVASLDDHVRQHLRDHAAKLSEVQSISWVNPIKCEETRVAWLESGAPDERSRTLGYRPGQSSE